MIVHGVEAAALVVLVGVLGLRLRAAILASWFLVHTGRWLAGIPQHGDLPTDAGWFRKGEEPSTGHIHRWWYKPGWIRCRDRIGVTLAPMVIIWGLLTAFWLTVWLLGACVLALAGFCMWRAWVWLRHREFDRTWLAGAHLALHELAGHPRAIRASSWISTEVNSSGAIEAATFKLTKGWRPDERVERQFVRIASERLSIEAAEPVWRHGGPAPLLTLRHSPPPPGRFGMADLFPEIVKLAANQLLIGVGKNEEPVIVSLHSDSPHIAISAGTGSGKSNMGSWLLFQMLVRGAIGMVLDPKRRLSYPWILKDADRNVVQLPNVAYAWRTPQLHASMAWLSTELDRRGDVAFAAMDTGGKVHANVGPGLFVIAEELNLAVPRLRAYWSQNRGPDDPAKSPAFTGLGDAAFAGRQVDKHLFLIGQMLTAEATGSRDSSVKEQCGVKILSRYGPKGWRIMAEDVPMPPPSAVLGRVQVVTAGRAQETQTPEFDPWEGRRRVLEGIVMPLPSTMPCGPPRPVVPDTPSVPVLISDQPFVSDSVPRPFPSLGPPDAVDLQVAAREIVGCTIGALRKAAQRPGFPTPVGRRGKAYTYDPDALRRWDAGRR